MGTASTEPSTQPPLVCRECGYSLDGLGNPLRCPECGLRQPRTPAANLQWLRNPPCRILARWLIIVGSTLLCCRIALRAVPLWVYVGGYPNGANENSWWWTVYVGLIGMCAAAGLIGLVVLTGLGFWDIAPIKWRVGVGLLIGSLVAVCL